MSIACSLIKRSTTIETGCSADNDRISILLTAPVNISASAPYRGSEITALYTILINFCMLAMYINILVL